jgi:PAS domain S-box-containing protein
MTPLQLLIVEDNPSDAALVLDALRHAGFEPSAVRVDTERDFVANLEPAPDIIFADFTMPNFDSLRALEIIQERRLDIPFIIVSGTIGEERAVLIMQRGASDYVIKDRLGRLGSAVKQALERRRLNAEKLKAEQTAVRLAAIVETSRDAIIAKTLDGRVTSWNPAAEQLYGYSTEEMLGTNIAILNPHDRRQRDDPEDVQAILDRLAKGEPISAFETVRVRKDGRRIEVLLSISPIRDEHGVVIGASAIALDITLRKRTERLLAANQAVTAILTEAENLQEAGPRVLQCIAECLRWEVAVLWTIDRKANVLGRMHCWHASWADPRFVKSLNHGGPLEWGVGVAGRTWSTGAPVWEKGIRVDGESTDPAPRPCDGLHCGFGLPMRHGTEMIGVIEFYNAELREVDKALLAGLDAIACQISQFCERRRTENALRASEEQFRQLADAMPQLVWTARADATIDYCNERFYEFNGSARGEYLDRSWHSMVYPDDRERVFKAWAHSASTGAAYETEARLIAAGAAIPRWFLVRAIASTDAAGAVTRWYGTCTDIDERKKNLDELRAGEERFRTLVMALPTAMYTTDQTGLITLFNEHAVKLWGRRPELGKDRWCGGWKVYRPDGSALPMDQHPMVVTLREGSGGHGQELIVERPDGSRSHVLMHPEPLRSPDGQTIGAVNMIIDITLMKHLEDQFRQSQKMEAVGQLAAGVAHDFNNLLTVILGYSILLLNKMPMADPNRDKLTQIRKAGESAAALTRQLLAFGRMQILAPVVLDLNSLLSELEKMLRRLVGADIEIVTVFQTDLGRVKVDAGQIEQVIINLVVNARDAMLTGGRLTIRTTDIELSDAQARTHRELLPGPYTMLAVSDTGVGMSDATKLRIFEPFFTTKEVGKGTGLGLATVFGIVKQSGGFIEVESTSGSGSTFRVFFPQVPGTADLAAAGHEPMNIPRGTETILLVDDNDDLRDLAQLILGTNGYKILVARNGGDAVRIGYEYKDVIHLLLTDVVMPKMSGRQLTDLLQPSRPRMKVLFMSGYTDDTMIRHGIEGSEANFLAKPFTPTHLTQKVREVLDGMNGKQSLENHLATAEAR